MGDVDDSTALVLETIAKKLRAGEYATPFCLAFASNGLLYSQYSLCATVEEYTSLIRATRGCLEALRGEKKRLVEDQKHGNQVSSKSKVIEQGKGEA